MSGISQHYVLNANEGEAVWFIGTLATVKASGALTGNIFSLVEFLHPPGFATPLHVHHTEDEAFYILEGAIRGINGDQPWYADAGSFVWLPRGIPHGYEVVGDKPVRTLAITIPSGFDRFVAESGTPAPERVLPPPAEPDIDHLLATATKYGQEILGPLVLT
ncbi:MAG TPA: cupin domain-containing protein [Spirillospora sp.]|nr:cupin domain-containing protein [Spirillospora sp.]